MKKCSKCNELLPLSKFIKRNEKNRKGYRSECRDCYNENYRNRSLFKKYKTTDLKKADALNIYRLSITQNKTF